jgi:hypothetical protein
MRTALKIFGLIALLVGIFIASNFAGILGKSAGRQAGEDVFAKTPTDTEVENSLAKLANANNAKLRETVGDSRIEREEAGPGRKYTYYMTLTGYSSSETNRAAIAAFAAQLKQNVCARKGMGGFFKHGISVVYVYSGNDAREIDRVTVTPTDCGY